MIVHDLPLIDTRNIDPGIGYGMVVTDHSLMSSDDDVLNVQLSTRSPRENVKVLHASADNQFIQHQIPQSDLGYAWIKNSTIETSASFIGHQSRFTHPVGLSNQTSSSPIFLSASAIGSARFRKPNNAPFDTGGDGSETFLEGYYPFVDKVFAQGSGKLKTTTDQVHVEDFQAFDFAGMNTFIVENINTETNLQGELADDFGISSFGASDSPELYTSSYVNATLVGPRGNALAQPNNFAGFSFPITGSTDRELDISRPGNKHSIVFLLNSLNANRGNSYGYNSWNQLRIGQKPVARLLRKKNIFNFAASKIDLPIGTNEDANPDKFRFRALAPFVESKYNWPDNITIQKRGRARRVDSSLTQFTESVASANSLPIRFENFYLRTDGTDQRNLARTLNWYFSVVTICIIVQVGDVYTFLKLISNKLLISNRV